jgi:hypothetical protein
VSQNQNKRKIEEVQAKINEMISAASASVITPFHIPSSDPSISGNRPKLMPFFIQKKEKQC